jgi:peptide/nickel transport system substrate-binding protein
VAGAAYDCGTGGEYKPGSPECNWTAEDWGAGWVFAPDYEPTGESIFYTGAAANYEGFDSAENDALIKASTQASSLGALYKWEDWLIDQEPVIFIPTATGNPAAGAVVFTSNHLGGYTNNLFTNITPETWYLTK